MQGWRANLHHEKLQFRVLYALDRIGQVGYTTTTDVRSESCLQHLKAAVYLFRPTRQSRTTRRMPPAMITVETGSILLEMSQSVETARIPFVRRFNLYNFTTCRVARE